MEPQTKIGTGAAAGIALVSLLEPHLYAWSPTVTVLVYIGLVCVMLWGFSPAVSGVVRHLRGTKMVTFGPWVLIIGGPLIGLAWLFLQSGLATSGSGAPAVYDGFELSNRLLVRLGKPFGGVEKSRGNYQATYEIATAIWIKTQRIWIVLSDHDQKWSQYSDPPMNVDTEADKRFWKYDELRKMFPKVPNDRLPPFAGLARLYQERPGVWQPRLGRYIRWHIGIDDLYFQEFDNGFAITSILDNPAVNRSFTLVLFKDDKSWVRFELKGAKKPETNPVMEFPGEWPEGYEKGKPWPKQ